MRLKSIPKEDQEWVNNLPQGTTAVFTSVFDSIRRSSDITTAKQLIIADMAHIIAECNDVILHVNAMKTPKECTCAGNCGDET